MSATGERYAFLRWGQQAFAISASCRRAPASAIRSIWNIWRQTVWTRKKKANGKKTVEYAFPDTLVGTDSHTTMINGLSVLGWGVGGIEAEAAMLGQPISMLIPEVIGFKLTGKLREGVHRHRSGADRHADAAQEGRGRQVRGILRPRAGRA